MEDAKICSFFGHRTIDMTEELYAKVYDEIEEALRIGCRCFYFGGYGDFDALCYTIVTEMKGQYREHEIRRVYCVPQERFLYKKVRYFNRESYDDVIYLTPAFAGWYKSIYFRNCAMIDKSDCIIFYAENRENSGAYSAYKYALKKKDKRLVNLWNAKNAAPFGQ